jgi:hypothetical protein
MIVGKASKMVIFYGTLLDFFREHINWLVVWNMNGLFFHILGIYWENMNGLFYHILGIMIPTDELHHFSEG